VDVVIPSEARNLALETKDLRDSSSPAAPRNDRLDGFFSILLDHLAPHQSLGAAFCIVLCALSSPAAAGQPSAFIWFKSNCAFCLLPTERKGLGQFGVLHFGLPWLLVDSACHLTPDTWNLLFPTYYLPGANYLSFQQHSRFKLVSVFVFYNIPALLRDVEDRSFVFIDIPASFLHFSKLLGFFFPCQA